MHAPASAQERSGAPLPRDADWSDEVVYFVLVDRFANGDPANDDKDVDPKKKGHFHGGDLKGLTQHLDEIAELGVTALWLNPLVKNIDGFVTGAGFPDYGYHGYWADDFSRLDPRFGTEAELTALIDACHRRGIKVLLDVVYNHVGYGSRYLQQAPTKGWLRSNELGTCGSDDFTSCVAGLPDFKSELPEVRDYLVGLHLPWAKRFGFDGFRLDTVKHLELDFWQQHRVATRKALGSGFFLLGELWGGEPDALAPYFESDSLDAGFDFSFQGNVVAFLQGRGRVAAFDAYLRRRHRVKKGHHLAHFLSSHDVPGALHLLQGDVAQMRLAAVLQLTTVGIPVVYYGEEVARAGGDWPDNRSDMPWGARAIAPGHGTARDDNLREDYRRLIHLRREHPALWRGTHQLLAPSRGLTDEGLYAFTRRDEETGEVLLIAINRGEKAATAELPLPEAWRGALPAEWFGSGPALVAVQVPEPSGSPKATDSARPVPGMRLAVPAKSARIFGVAASPRPAASNPVTPLHTAKEARWPESSSGTSPSVTATSRSSKE